jgi:RHS repeat-associated protein
MPSCIVYDEGRVVYANNSRTYFGEVYLKDHLGNVRVACRRENGVLKTRQVDSYYPFGMNIKGLTLNSTDVNRPNKYLYNGKQMQDEMGLGWLDYGARFYDGVLGRWHSMEPYAELVPGISPYAYCYDSPVNFNEPDGKWPPWVHKHIIRKALNPYIGHGLTEDQLNAIIKGGAYIDDNFQAAQFSYMHSMLNGLTVQPILSAIAARDEWVSSNISNFKNSNHTLEDFKILGYAIHAMSDQYAPTHNWKPWKGQSAYNPTSWIHSVGELNPLGSKSSGFKLSIELVVKTYLEGTTSNGESEQNQSPSSSPAPGREPSQPIDPMTPRPLPDPSQAPPPLEPRPLPPSPQPFTPIPFTQPRLG